MDAKRMMTMFSQCSRVSGKNNKIFIIFFPFLKAKYEIGTNVIFAEMIYNSFHLIKNNCSNK